MMKTLESLIVKFNEKSAARLTESWTWLIGTGNVPIMISAIGDMFLKNKNGKVYWLDVGRGEFRQVADGLSDFVEKLENIEQVNEWFMIQLTTALRDSKNKLKPGQVYSYNKLPIMGGDYVVDNFMPIDIEAHFGFTGEIHKQIKDLSHGTNVEVVIKD
jgi:hypothetical protein